MTHAATTPSRRRAAAWLLLAVFAAGACGDRSLHAGREDEHSDPDREAATGPHGGRWLADGGFAVELALQERTEPPALRAWVFADGAPRDPAGVSLDVTLRRLGGREQRISFTPRGDHLVGDVPVEEPHSFDVEVVARAEGREHRFAYASHEGRIALDPEQVAAAGIEIAEAGPAEIRERVVLNGRIVPDAETLVRVAPRFPGVLRAVHKRLGDPVAPGELLAVVESNESLHSYELRAPRAGTVIARDGAPGEFVGVDRALLVIADLSAVWVEFDVHRPEFGRVRAGQPVWIDGGVETAISQLSPIGAASTQTLRARAVLPNPDRAWRPGIFVTGAVETARRTVGVAVAPAAIQRWRDGDAVFVVEGDVFEARPVVLGARDGEHVEVVAGLAPGQRYVAAGSFVVKAEVGKAGAAHDH